MAYDGKPWIKVYTTDTPGWVSLSIQARGLMLEIARKLSWQTGELSLGRKGLPGLARLLHATWDEISEPLAELIADGRLIYDEQAQTIRDPKHAERQKSVDSSALRMRRYRQRKATSTESDVTPLRAVTQSDEPLRGVTDSDAPLRAVTQSDEPLLIDQIRSDQIRSEEILPPHPQTGLSLDLLGAREASRGPDAVQVPSPEPPAAPDESGVHEVIPAEAPPSREDATGQRRATETPPEPKPGRKRFAAGATAYAAREAYVEAVAVATGAPYVLTSAPYHGRDLVDLLNGHAPPGSVQDALTWLARTIGEWVSSSDARYSGGWTPGKLAAWLQSGRPSRESRTDPRRIRQPLSDALAKELADKWQVADFCLPVDPPKAGSG